MANSLFPACVHIAYHSAYAPHIQVIPTLEWLESPGDFGSFETWAAGTVDAETMIEQLITAQAEFFPATVVFDSFSVFTYETPTSEPQLRVSKNLAIAGTAVAAGWSKAAQATWSFKTTLGGELKIVHLDVNTLNAWDKITSATASGDQTTFINALVDDANGWAGRDGGQPIFFQQIAFTLNEKLRRNYYMN